MILCGNCIYFVFNFTIYIQIVKSELHDLYSTHEETDTRIPLYIKHAIDLGFKYTVVRSPDSDAFFILLAFASSLAIIIYLDTGTGKGRQLVNVSVIADEIGEEWCQALLALYIFTGDNVNSAFKGKGKLVPLKKLQQNPRFHGVFR